MGNGTMDVNKQKMVDPLRSGQEM